MNTRELIQKLTKLPENTHKSSIRISPQPTENGKRKWNRNRPVKNSNLVMDENGWMSPEERSIYYSTECSLDEAHISGTVLQAYGGEVPSDKNIEHLIEVLINTKREITSEDDAPTVDKLSHFYGEEPQNQPILETSSYLNNAYCPSNKNKARSRKSKSERGKQVDCEKRTEEIFPKNILMRRILLDKQLESLSLESSSLESSSTSGKDHDSDCTPNSFEFVEMPDESDVLLRPGMIGKGILEDRPIDDGYRFDHHGIKKTITPRRYLMEQFDDDNFNFKKL